MSSLVFCIKGLSYLPLHESRLSSLRCPPQDGPLSRKMFSVKICMVPLLTLLYSCRRRKTSWSWHSVATEEQISVTLWRRSARPQNRDNMCLYSVARQLRSDSMRFHQTTDRNLVEIIKMKPPGSVKADESKIKCKSD